MSSLFTASRIAQALGKPAPVIRQQLRSIEPAKTVIRGKLADAWPVAILPDPIRTELQETATRQGYRQTEDLLKAPPQIWEPPLPLDQIAPHCLDKAARLQRALFTALQRCNDPALSAAELESIGLEDYHREFGHRITARHWRNLFQRTLERDGNREDWHNILLYVDENPARKITAPPAISSLSADFPQLTAAIARCKNRVHLTNEEQRLLWILSFETYQEQIALEGGCPKKAKLKLLKFLWKHAPSLASSANALRVNWQRKYNKWLESGGDAKALRDGRQEKSGHFRAPEMNADDRDKIVFHAAFNCGGRVSQAWRELVGRQELSESILSYYLANPANKSHVPTTIRELVKYEVAMLEDEHRGPRTAKLNGAYLLRDWSGVAPMDWLCADDITLPVYYWIPNGKGGFTLMRGQCLLFIDVRSTRILGFALQSERNYNSRVIRTLVTKVCEEHGLPRKGFLFENGLWKNSKILTGDNDAEIFSWGEVELGLREFGLRFWHSRLPRSKPVERVIGAVQDLMEGEPGYVGRNEIVDKFERVQKAKLEVERGALHPGGNFYNVEQWIERMAQIFETYNAAPQNGKVLDGLSPDEAFQKFANISDPPIRFGSTCRYLLAHHKRPIRVGSNGITLRFGKQVFNYRNEKTGELRGQTVLAWFNPELPEILTVTDMNRQNPFSVARTKEVPAMDADSDLLAQEVARIEAHQSFAKVRYRTLKSKFAPQFRSNFVDGETVELGQAIASQHAEIITGQNEERARMTKARKVYDRLGTVIPKRLNAEELEAAEKLARKLENII